MTQDPMPIQKALIDRSRTSLLSNALRAHARSKDIELDRSVLESNPSHSPDPSVAAALPTAADGREDEAISVQMTRRRSEGNLDEGSPVKIK